nr:mannose-6-phosphate isomerase, class I [Vibrio paucivorans]
MDSMNYANEATHKQHIPAFLPMHNVIQNYAWGSTNSLQSLFGFNNDKEEPQAELWMGAHPNGCSYVDIDGQQHNLAELIARQPEQYLGKTTFEQFGELPYLFKVLAAEKALSIQVHPSKLQAEAGFLKEQNQGTPLTAGNRNYKDPNHKPELVYALTLYQAMNGFRSLEEIIEYFAKLDISELAPIIDHLINNQTDLGLSQFFSSLLTLDEKIKQSAINKLIDKVSIIEEPVCSLISKLADQYPGDIGLFSPLILNVITLQPGEAMFLDAQTPHAYIKGTGLEIMANSDNVLRAGLTPKYIDVEELIACTRFEPKPLSSLKLSPTQSGDTLNYAIPVDDFKFSILSPTHPMEVETQSGEILLAIDSLVNLQHTNGDSCDLKPGQSVFIPACSERYTVKSAGRVARAFC